LEGSGEIAACRLGGGDEDDCQRPLGLWQQLLHEHLCMLNLSRFR
jgi:hypothetical protein